jgi:hypothetical protein
VLLGNSGHGKSQAALEYARTQYANRKYESVIWVDACSEATGRLSLAEICDNLDGRSEDLDTPHKVEKLLRILEESTPEMTWLMMFDNYDNYVLDNDQQSIASNSSRTSGAASPVNPNPGPQTFGVTKYIPVSAPGNIIITSRDSKVKKHGHVIGVGKMSVQDAAAMLRSRYRARQSHWGWDEAAAKELLAELSGFILARLPEVDEGVRRALQEEQD